jgi:peptidoglycan/xylan/chitin deacetylase (PgdA/CDA1 family)
LRLVRELRTPLYRIQCFRRDGTLTHCVRRVLSSGRLGRRAMRSSPRVSVLAEQPVLPPPEVAALVRWQGGSPEIRTSRQVETDRLPILMYHRVAPQGADAVARYRVTPTAFAEQLAFLRDAGYQSVTPSEWGAAAEGRRALPGRAVLLTFDDGYADFAEHAWPLLRRFGFGATLFVVAGEAGGSNRWDRRFGEELPLLGWDDLRRLRAEGVDIGAHSISHPPFTNLSPDDVAREAAGARAILQRELHEPIRAFAYPYGDTDPAVEHLVGACGYAYGFTCRGARAELTDPLLSLPRIEVEGTDDLARVVAKLEG